MPNEERIEDSSQKHENEVGKSKTDSQEYQVTGNGIMMQNFETVTNSKDIQKAAGMIA